ncbi:MAG TPA: hypothetical protein VGN57_19160 [Pirellulaceae bacterium]|jgi:Dyp-type peroxidase family|nr:hypothetical protein [Pirellulaceae bacterium]
MEPVKSGEATREPFGFVDGISQPMIRGTRLWTPDSPSIHVVAPGEFILGYPDHRGFLPPSPSVPASDDSEFQLPSVGRTASATGTTAADAIPLRRDLGCNGSFLVIRQLRQDVTGFDDFTRAIATELMASKPPGVPVEGGFELVEEWVAAKLVGRWRDGSSLVRNPLHPASWNPARSEASPRGTEPLEGEPHDGEAKCPYKGSPLQGASPPAEPDNTFLYGAEDPMGYRCPFGAHVRRSNPRDSMHGADERELGVVNRHRILRVGRPYVQPDSDATKAHEQHKEGRGLLFMCLNADIERQFEFVQQTWAMARLFHGLAGEVDSVIGRGQKGGRLTIPSPEGPIIVKGIKDYVDVLGGAYFFVPSRRAIRFLAKATASTAPEGAAAPMPLPPSAGTEGRRSSYVIELPKGEPSHSE